MELYQLQGAQKITILDNLTYYMKKISRNEFTIIKMYSDGSPKRSQRHLVRFFKIDFECLFIFISIEEWC